MRSELPWPISTRKCPAEARRCKPSFEKPVAPAIVTDMAESFRSLETDRAAVDAFRAARDGVERYMMFMVGSARGRSGT